MTPEAKLRKTVREQRAEIRELREKARDRVLLSELNAMTPDSALLVVGPPTRPARVAQWILAHTSWEWLK